MIALTLEKEDRTDSRPTRGRKLGYDLAWGCMDSFRGAINGRPLLCGTSRMLLLARLLVTDNGEYPYRFSYIYRSIWAPPAGCRQIYCAHGNSCGVHSAGVYRLYN